ncbi:MAG: hypothetical protein GWO16_04255 [Gammaproteobacteria bacterium]|nr:hypothetical protein [Gammaproteobacteria bacterium]NIR28879.1 hypothetical protein [Gammaproteobacteria bacterium]NIR97275.1 hypothetical protein [Gammaproteobacteria bacterium]NIT62975.1 hypothetical protein [Gammaproteobacteria bacterium]NIV19934.1 hypothetical protein [Gammaproteobacteria bacterium]
MEHTASIAMPRTASRHWIWSARGFVAVTAAYCLLHLLLRLALTPTLGVDDIDQALLAQELAWGYSVKQPPLYTWILLALYKTLGVSLATHIVLKYALVFATFLFLYLGARAVVRDPAMAVMAGLSPLLMYYLAVGAHQGFTHSLVLSVCIAAAFWLTVRWVRAGSALDYAALGVVYGLGLLSKYNFAVFALSALAAGLTVPGVRARILHPRMLITLLAGAVVFAPHAWWLAHHLGDPAQPELSTSLPIRGGAYLADVWSGVASLAVGALSFLAPLWIALLAVFPWAWRRLPGRGEAPPWRRFLGAQMLWGLGLVTVALAAFPIGHIESRWLHPLLLLFPIYFALRAEAAEYRATAPRRMLYVMAAFSVLVVMLRIGQIHVGPYFGQFGRFHQPFPELAREIGAAGFRGGTVIAADDHIAGNFRLVFPQSRIVTPMYPFWVPRPATPRGDCLLLWYGRDGDAPPQRLRDFVRRRLGLAGLGARGVSREMGIVEQPVRHSRARSLALGYWLIPEEYGCGR